MLQFQSKSGINGASLRRFELRFYAFTRERLFLAFWRSFGFTETGIDSGSVRRRETEKRSKQALLRRFLAEKRCEESQATNIVLY